MSSRGQKKLLESCKEWELTLDAISKLLDEKIDPKDLKLETKISKLLNKKIKWRDSKLEEKIDAVGLMLRMINDAMETFKWETRELQGRVFELEEANKKKKLYSAIQKLEQQKIKMIDLEGQRRRQNIRITDPSEDIAKARTGASPAIVNGVLGHSVSLFPSIPVRQDVDEVVWKRSSPSTKIARYLEELIKYFNTIYNNRITLHSRNFSLEIHDLRKEDAAEYEVIVTAGDSGDERRERIQLKVYELVSGANITVQTNGIYNLTLTCTVTSGDHTSFTWWRNGEALVNDSTRHIRVLGNTLEVHHTAEVEDAVYKCEARNLISNEMAEIKLRDMCKLDTCGDNFLKSISALIASINIVGVIVGLIFSLYFTLRRSATGERGSAGKYPTALPLGQEVQPSPGRGSRRGV
ncbi:SLAM family member 5-like [Hypanus sabinus]|uniref:SLAM family member 5-like n=1 Tax=Hypanus sabinus TaxID=79690 RepID=UPI0028C3FAF8|nr:SLAM family member 5-like [Hypanus sabinus]